MSLFTPGLVSITFRQLSPREIIELMQKVGLRCLEWGGDIHVPHGKVDVAREVAAMTTDAGLEIAAYGSYYRSVPSVSEGLEFSTVLKSAVALGAPSIRIWPGNKASSQVSEEEREKLTAGIHTAADLAATEGKIVTLEYHANTLTDTAESAARLMKEAEHPALKTLWQPPNGMPTEECLIGLRQALPVLDNVHVFHWWPTSKERHSLAEGKDRWATFFGVLREEGTPRCVLMEFVRGNEPEQFLADAATLKAWLEPFQ